MRFIRLLFFVLVCVPVSAVAASREFTMAAQLLSAAKNADIQQVQVLIGNGANINYVDNTGLSLVCTALMNNDLRAAQILQMYGADASQCDRQIKNYRSQNSGASGGGIFGGLSTAQSLTLAAAGAAVVIGGLFLLTDIFDPDNDNKTSGGASGGGSGGSGGGSNTNAGTAWSVGALPYGPLMINAAAESNHYANNLAMYAPSDTASIYYKNFQLMNATENYLLLMHGYSPLARGYLGMRTLRKLDNVPVVLSGSYGANLIQGGRPVNVALITANGINAATNTSLENNFLVWTSLNSDGTLGPASQNTISGKYYNNGFVFNSVDNYSAPEDASLISTFDLSNGGTAIHNGAAIADSILAKIVGGNVSGFADADFIGFMPNGQMTIYRTGGGQQMVSSGGAVAGSFDFAGDTIDVEDTMTFSAQGITATVASITDGGDGDTTKSIVWSYVDGDGTKYLYGYLLGGLYYIDFDGNGAPDFAYGTNSSNQLVTKLESQNTDYKNYTALYDAVTNRTIDASSGGRSRVDVIANLDVIEPLHETSALVIDDIFEGTSSVSDWQEKLSTAIVNAYSVGGANNQIGTDAGNFFRAVGGNNAIAVFSTGATKQSSQTYSDVPRIATIENAAPIAYSNLNHSFMSIVAVGASTVGATSIPANVDNLPVGGTKLQLAQWAVGNESDGYTYYKSRVCGTAGIGYGSIDPWCFASVGVTDEMATAAAAGATGALRSAFYYMTPQQIFTLMALTADGPYLNRLTVGTQLNEAALISHLQSLYIMPGVYQQKIDAGQMSYLDAFKEVFGYGVINLERATTPGTNLYFYDGTKISSTSGDAYWRAAMNTGFLSSATLGGGRHAINITTFDVMESIDGALRLPRVWENTVMFGGNTRHSFYMGDTLGDLRTRANDDNTIKIGAATFNLMRSARAYDDGMGGIDNLRLEYAVGDWSMAADYQRYLTDGESRFAGMANPVLSLVSNAVTSGAHYVNDNWVFGVRGFSGSITDEGLLEYDPTISAEFEPGRWGLASGGGAEIGWRSDKFGVMTTIGMVHENNTILGAYGTGLMSINSADTRYIDVDAFVRVTDMVRLRARATFAHTTPNMFDNNMFELSELDSDAFAFGTEIGNRFDFVVSMPLATRRGNLAYAYAEYDIIPQYDPTELDNGRYALVIHNADMRAIDIAAPSRAVRIDARYRHKFGEFTDGAIGFIYRIHPNNTDEFGNESIFMMKLSHRLGI